MLDVEYTSSILSITNPYRVSFQHVSELSLICCVRYSWFEYLQLTNKILTWSLEKIHPCSSDKQSVKTQYSCIMMPRVIQAKRSMESSCRSPQVSSFSKWWANKFFGKLYLWLSASLFSTDGLTDLKLESYVVRFFCNHLILCSRNMSWKRHESHSPSFLETNLVHQICSSFTSWNLNVAKRFQCHVHCMLCPTLFFYKSTCSPIGLFILSTSCQISSLFIGVAKVPWVDATLYSNTILSRNSASSFARWWCARCLQ